MRNLLLIPLFLIVCAPVRAQHHAAHSAAEPGKGIKALSANEVEGYRAGRGMGLARAAEMNRYPGPMHVLELADSLGLTTEQLARTREIRQQVLEESQALGATLIEQEEALDRLFAGGTATPDAVDALTAAIAGTHGRLRAAHLRAHVAQHAILTPEQIAAYNRLRGYDE